MGVVLCGGLGEGNPVIQETELWFNGDGDKGLDHETFSIHWRKPANFDFCKTARKPYDIMVGLSLLILQKYLGQKVLTFSSDGDDEDWAEIYAVYEKAMGEPAPRFNK